MTYPKGTTVSFPQDFRCDGLINEMYLLVEPRMLPLIKIRSRKLSSFTPNIEFEDAVQEGRLALLAAISKFDFNKVNGRLEGYVQRVITNTYHCMLYEALTQSRVPYVWRKDDDGQWIKKPRFPLSLDAMLAAEGENEAPFEPTYEDQSNPDDEIYSEQLAPVARQLNMRMLFKLKGRDEGSWEKEVFRCKVHPPAELLSMMKDDGEDVDMDDPTSVCVGNKHIAKYLGINKNMVDWAMHKVKKLFTSLAKYDEDFSEIFDDIVNNKGWPMIHYVRGDNHDEAFQARILKKRKLDTRPLDKGWPESENAGEECYDGTPYWSRLVQNYPWGSKVVLKRGQEYVTMVIEGRLNLITGEVFGDDGLCENLPISWYGQLARALKGTEATENEE